MHNVAQPSKPDEDEFTSRVPDEEVRTALERLLADSRFRASERNRRFLRFVLEEALAGRGDRIKSYIIAVEVFGRSVDFDAETDPIVRIEATRLRAALDTYYSGPGREETIRISLPKGRYVPAFEATPADEDPAPSQFEPLKPLLALGRARSARGLRHYAVWSMAAIVLASVVFGMLFLRGFPSRSSPEPQTTIRISPTVAVTSQATESLGAQGLTQSLQLALTRIRGARIIWVPPNAPALATPSDEFGAGKTYDVASTLRIDRDTLRVVWRLSDATTGEIIQADFMDLDATGGSTIAVEDQVAQTIASRIGALMDTPPSKGKGAAGQVR
ncbi:hypothetical protein EET67_21320 [Pseudaminobacter arsenicus]|uniref:Uncharacterized protein n=1 Tax=Borborobacter arsenicus TaxID=1851146 RepID=A0A432V0Q9_9HYPH|nr:hypothetical protein [Pseudaminobacter arsenicus]RUM95750.1 hypothetical protein EET67_21320 [Pseudaminobacter arsenicus]